VRPFERAIGFRQGRELCLGYPAEQRNRLRNVVGGDGSVPRALPFVEEQFEDGMQKMPALLRGQPGFLLALFW
jgi:hypothetical protein